MPPSTDPGNAVRVLDAKRMPGTPALGAAMMAGQFLTLNAIGLFATAYIIRRLGPLQYGQFATASALASAHLLLTGAGLRTIFVRDVARRPERAAELLASQLALRLTLSGGAAACAVLVAAVLGYPPVVLSCTAVGALGIALSVVSSTFSDFLQALERFASYSAVAFTAGIAVTAASLVAVWLGCGAVGLTVSYLSAPLVSAGLYWKSVRQHVDIRIRLDAASARALLREARLTGTTQVIAAMRDRAEQLLVPRLVGLEAFGIFGAGAMIGDRLSNVPDAVCTAFYPRISQSAGGASDAALTRSVARMLSVSLAASAPFAIIATHLATATAAILLPADQAMCRTVIAVTVWAVPLLAIALSMTAALQATGHHDGVARRGLIATCVSIAASAALVSNFGIVGASVAVVARPATLVVSLLPLFRRTFPDALATVPLIRIALAAGLLASICVRGSDERLVTALMFAATGASVYALALIGARVFSVDHVVGLRPVAAAERSAI